MILPTRPVSRWDKRREPMKRMQNFHSSLRGLDITVGFTGERPKHLVDIASDCGAFSADSSQYQIHIRNISEEGELRPEANC